MDESKSDELRAAYLDIQQAQTRLDADREAIRKKILASEPSWGPCHQCGHTWRSRNIRRRLGKPPRQCPNCKSHYWFDPEYVPRGPHAKVPVQSGKAAGAETKEALPSGIEGGPASSNGTAPAATNTTATFAMPPPPKFAPPESVRFAEDDPLEMMKKARKDDDTDRS